MGLYGKYICGRFKPKNLIPSTNCLWCSTPINGNGSIEHVNGRKVKIEKSVITVACCNCNAEHGQIVDAFRMFVSGKYRYKWYREQLVKMFARQNSFLNIIQHPMFAYSIEEFKYYRRFPLNPTNIVKYMPLHQYQDNANQDLSLLQRTE